MKPVCLAKPNSQGNTTKEQQNTSQGLEENQNRRRERRWVVFLLQTRDLIPF
jgi:hypothetical protein